MNAKESIWPLTFLVNWNAIGNFNLCGFISAFYAVYSVCSLNQEEQHENLTEKKCKWTNTLEFNRSFVNEWKASTAKKELCPSHWICNLCKFTFWTWKIFDFHHNNRFINSLELIQTDKKFLFEIEEVENSHFLFYEKFQRETKKQNRNHLWITKICW